MTEAETSKIRTHDATTDDDAGMARVVALIAGWRWLLGLPLATGLTALGISFVIAPTFTARTSFLPPQQSQSSAASALASLGALAGLAGGAAGIRTPADQFVALMQSTTVADRLVDQFELIKVYDVETRTHARRELSDNVRMTIGKKDGLITVEVDDKSPGRAANIANRYVDELRRLTAMLAITEAQQRRVFFERQLQQTRDKLVNAQQALQASGFSQGALRTEPKAAAEAYARLRAETTAAEVRLQALRSSLVDETPEVSAQQSALSALRAQLARIEQVSDASAGPDYVGKYREFKYQEALFELFARQYELARVDESREGALIQVVDVASPPERKSRPKRALVAIVTFIATLLVVASALLIRCGLRDPERRATWVRLRAAHDRS